MRIPKPALSAQKEKAAREWTLAPRRLRASHVTFMRHQEINHGSRPNYRLGKSGFRHPDDLRSRGPWARESQASNTGSSEAEVHHLPDFPSGVLWAPRRQRVAKTRLSPPLGHEPPQAAPRASTHSHPPPGRKLRPQRHTATGRPCPDLWDFLKGLRNNTNLFFRPRAPQTPDRWLLGKVLSLGGNR